MNLCRFLDSRRLPFERQQTLRWFGGGGTPTVLNVTGEVWSLLSNVLEHDDLLD